MAEPPPPSAVSFDPLVDEEETEVESEDDFGAWQFRNKSTATKSGARHGVASAHQNTEEPLANDKREDNSKRHEPLNYGTSIDTAINLADDDDDDDSSLDELPLQSAACVTDSDHSDGGKQSPADPSLEDPIKSLEESEAVLKDDKSESDCSTEDGRKQPPEKSKDPSNAAEEIAEERESLCDEEQFFGTSTTSDYSDDDSSDDGGFLYSTKSTNREDSKAEHFMDVEPYQNYVFGSPAMTIDLASLSDHTKVLKEFSEESNDRSMKLSKQMSTKEWKADIARRRTDDGCVRPPVLKKNHDGTYAKPPGRSPLGTVWDHHRGLWCPHKQKGKQRKRASSTSKRSHIPEKSDASSGNDEHDVMEGESISEDKEYSSSEDESGRVQDTPGNLTLVNREDRDSGWTEDGYYRPRTLKKKEDGTFAQPCGRGPPETEWDARRGVFVPAAETKVVRRSSESGKQSDARTTSISSGSDQNGAQGEEKKSRKRKGAEDESHVSRSAAQNMYQDDRALKRAKRTVEGERSKSRTSLAPSAQLSRKGPQGSAPSNTLRTKSMKSASLQPKRKSSSKALRSDSGNPRDPDIGDHVYACWKNGKYYWATIVGKRKTNSLSAQDEHLYSLLFFDNDYLASVPADELHTAHWCREFLGIHPEAKHKDHDEKVRELVEKWRGSSTEDTREKKLPGTYSLQELYEYRCQDCDHCKKPDCGACVSCRRNEMASEDELEVCVQKMCLCIPDSKKKQSADGLLPPKWSFLFKEETTFTDSKKPHIPGLFVYHPKGNKVFRSAEAVVAFVPSFLYVNPNAVVDFNRYIGFTKDARPPQTNEQQLGSRHSPLTEGSCECPNCSKDDCGRCASCLSSPPRVCIQKICCEAPKEDKVQPMPPSSRFPSGWTFVIDPTMVGYNYSKAQAEREGKTVFVDGLKIFSPAQDREYYSAETAKGHYRKALANVNPTKFYQYIGALPGLSKETSSKKFLMPKKKSTKRDAVPGALPTRELRRLQHSTTRETRTTTSSFLCGRNLCFEWTDVNGTPKVVYGTVTECNENVHSNKVTSCKVVYSEKSRAVTNKKKNGCGVSVPESAILEPSVVIGGCTRFEEEFTGTMDRLSDYAQLPLGLKWIIPDLRLEEIVDGSPRLTLFVRGYQLVLEVKPSTIPNAGNGLFLSCEPIIDCVDDESDDEQESFVLEPGEFIDLGVYGPLRIQDMKLKAAFYVKNFIHSYSCEEWVYGQQFGGHIDVTDDFTGELHDIAKRKVLPYVNECDDEEDITVLQDYDPEGSMHYLLGHPSESQGQFRLQCNKGGVELFMNYNDGYEKVRVRKGYSSLPEQFQRDIWEGPVGEDMSDLLEMDAFEVEDVRDATNFLFMLFSAGDESKFADDTIERALLCAAVLHRRAQLLCCDANGKLKRSLQMSGGLVRVLLGMANDENAELKTLFERGDVDGLLQKILRQTYAAADLAQLGDMIE